MYAYATNNSLISFNSPKIEVDIFFVFLGNLIHFLRGCYPNRM